MFKERSRQIIKTYLGSLINEEDLNLLIDRLYVEHKNNKYILMYKSDTNFRWMNILDILYIEQKKGILYTHFIDDHMILKSKILDLIKVIDGHDDFLKCNKNLMVNLTRVKKFDSYMSKLYFDKNISVPVSQRIIKKITGIIGSKNDISIGDGYPIIRKKK